MKKIQVDQMEIAKTPHNVDVRKLFSFEHATIVHITLKPGEKLRTHVTPVDAFFFGLEGNGIVMIGDEEENLTENELVFSPKKVKHTLKNQSNEIFRFLVIKVPSQKEKTKLL